MTDLPDSRHGLRYAIEAEKKDPVRQTAPMRDAIDEIEIHLQYGIPGLKLIGCIIVILLALILWHLW